MPASMMIAPAGFMLNVSGSSIAIVAGGPSPGRTPTIVPRNTPTKHHRRFAGSNATENPCSRPVRMSTLEAQRARGKREAQREVEHQIEPGPGRGGDDRRGSRRLAVHDRDDEIGEQREADDEADQLEQGDRYGEREPHAERAADPRPVRGFSVPRRGSEAGSDQQGRQREHGDAVPQREEPGSGSLGGRIVPLPRLGDDEAAEQRERKPRPQVARASGPFLHALPPARYFFLRGFL